MTMFVVVFYKDGQPLGVVSREGYGFVICMIAETVWKAEAMGKAMREILGWDYQVFVEASP